MDPAREVVRATPCLRLFADTLYVGEDEIETAMLRLDFEIGGRRTRRGPAEAGRVRLLGVGTATRVSLKPDLPTIQEQGVADYAVRSWTGAFLQRGTPRAIIETLSAAFKEALETPLARTRLRDIGSEPLFMDPAATDAFVREEYTRWSPVVRAANIRIE